MAPQNWKRDKSEEDSKHVRAYTHEGIGGLLHVEKREGGGYRVDMHREDRPFFGNYMIYENKVDTVKEAERRAEQVMRRVPKDASGGFW